MRKDTWGNTLLDPDEVMETAQMFLQNNYRAVPSGGTPIGDVYDHYARRCREHGVVVGRPEARRALRNLIGAPGRNMRVGGKVQRCFPVLPTAPEKKSAGDENNA